MTEDILASIIGNLGTFEAWRMNCKGVLIVVPIIRDCDKSTGYKVQRVMKQTFFPSLYPKVYSDGFIYREDKEYKGIPKDEREMYKHLQFLHQCSLSDSMAVTLASLN